MAKKQKQSRVRPIAAAKAGAKMKQPSRDNPLARDARGTASREEIRTATPRVNAPRQSKRPIERSNEERAHER